MAACSARSAALPAALRCVALLFIAVPIVYAISWVIASAARRTPFSLMLTGREYSAGKGGAALAPRTRFTMMGRFLVLLTAFITTLGLAMFAGAHIINAVERQSTTTTYSMKVGNLTRSWEVIAPTAKLPKSAPIVVVLSGIAATTSDEITRDRLVPYVDTDKLELVYPVSYQASWNAIGCCGAAASTNVNDVAFLEALVPKVDPGHTRPIYFVGYSNGGRMAYRLECTDPSLFNGMVAVKADPMPGCVVTKPQNVLVFASLDDPVGALQARGERQGNAPGHRPDRPAAEGPQVLQQGRPSVKHGDMTLYTWSLRGREDASSGRSIRPEATTSRPRTTSHTGSQPAHLVLHQQNRAGPGTQLAGTGAESGGRIPESYAGVPARLASRISGAASRRNSGRSGCRPRSWCRTPSP